MTVQAMPWSIQGASHPAENARNVLGAMFGVPVAAHTAAASVTTAGGGHGVVGAGDLAVTQNGTPNMSVNVAAGRAIIRSGGTSSLLSASYSFLNDATVNVAIAAADPTNPRIDYVIAEVRDTNYGQAANDARITTITGTPAAVPVAPALTSNPNCVVLAQVAVAAAATTIITANITDKRTRAASLGGTQVCTLLTRPTGASLYAGLRIYETDTFRELTYDGTGWVIMSEPAQTYTPTWVNLTVGNGSQTAWYHRADGWVDFSVFLTFGTTTSIAGNVTVTAPIASNVVTSFDGADVRSSFYDSSASQLYNLQTFNSSTTVMNLYAQPLVGSYVAITPFNATVPVAFGLSDRIAISGRYRMTTRYS